MVITFGDHISQETLCAEKSAENGDVHYLVEINIVRFEIISTLLAECSSSNT